MERPRIGCGPRFVAKRERGAGEVFREERLVARVWDWVKAEGSPRLFGSGLKSPQCSIENRVDWRQSMTH
jgi:hypothetical protein